MINKETIIEAFQYLKDEGIVKTQQDVADKMSTSKANVSAAFNGNERFLTEGFVIRFNNAFDNLFNTDWLLTGSGSMLRPSVSQTVNAPMTVGRDNNVGASSPSPDIQKALDEIAEQRKLVAKSQEQIDRLLTLLERYGK